MALLHFSYLLTHPTSLRPGSEETVSFGSSPPRNTPSDPGTSLRAGQSAAVAASASPSARPAPVPTTAPPPQHVDSSEDLFAVLGAAQEEAVAEAAMMGGSRGSMAGVELSSVPGRGSPKMPPKSSAALGAGVEVEEL